MTELLTAQSAELPRAVPTAVSAPFWAACARHELIYQRCADCAAIGFPPAEHCRTCLSPRLRWENSAGTARLYSWTVVWRPVTPAFVTPYAPAIVTVDEGYQMMTNLIGAEPDRLVVDMPLRVSFHQAGELHLPYFEPR
jgi:uncharacterized protein